jgi:hypothetical protein
MNIHFWNKLFELIRILIRAPHRAKADADRLEAVLDEIMQEVECGEKSIRKSGID